MDQLLRQACFMAALQRGSGFGSNVCANYAPVCPLDQRNVQINSGPWICASVPVVLLGSVRVAWCVRDASCGLSARTLSSTDGGDVVAMDGMGFQPANDAWPVVTVFQSLQTSAAPSRRATVLLANDTTVMFAMPAGVGRNWLVRVEVGNVTNAGAVRCLASPRWQTR